MLEPVSLVRVEKLETGILVETDTGTKGEGQDFLTAIADLHDGAASVVFLDTAEWLLLPDSESVSVEELLTVFRPSVRVCVWEGGAEWVVVASYLKIHEPTVTLAEIRAGDSVADVFKTGKGENVFERKECG